MKNTTVFREGFFTFSRDGKEVKIEYNQIQKPEMTFEGKIGKWCPFGFVLKPGQKIKPAYDKIQNDDEIDKKERKKRKKRNG